MLVRRSYSQFPVFRENLELWVNINHTNCLRLMAVRSLSLLVGTSRALSVRID